jgi:serine/threonine protein kinase
MADPADVHDIFDQAVERSAAARAAFLERACGQDAALRSEVERLLAAHDRLNTVFDTETPEELDASVSFPVPQSVGSYRVVKELGRGGVGAVFLAVREDEYTKQVAIKLLRPGTESAEIVRRFRRERQILASIDHPYIAKLLDGGSTTAGPYLVMEYVEGKAIDAYCDDAQLTVMERLELFRKVCDAVHFAHQNLVVHRDLKPGNILVTPDGVPKLLDFGIAKLLDPTLFAVTVDPTRPESRMMTPEYASPEQVKGDAITTASDIYSLGVLLYKLLTGHSPYRIRTGQFHELAKAICEDEPTRPSTVIDVEEDVSDATGVARRITADSVSRSREGSRDRLRRKLRGDLDHIVLTAMRKEPHRRYASVEQFSDDILRYREQLPVRARKGTWSYRTSRFAKRHRVGLAAVSLFIISLIGAIAVTVAERRRAERESERANAVIEFLTTTLAAVDPRIAQGDEPTVRQLLDEAETRLVNLPYLEESAIREVIAESRFQLGHLRQARDQYLKLVDASTVRLGATHRDTLAARAGLAATQAELGELREAEQSARAAISGYTSIASREPQATLRAWNTLARVLLRLGTRDRLAEAERILANSIARSAALPPDDVDRLTARQLHAQLKLAQGKLLDGEPLARDAYQTTLAALGPRHPLTLEAYDTVSYALLALGRYDELLTTQQRHVEATRRVLGDDHVMTLRARHTIAETLRQLDRFVEAKKVYDEVLASKARVLGENHRSTLLTRHTVALLHKDLQQPDQAERLLREVARVRREVLGLDHADTLDSEMMIALTLYEQKRLEESRHAYAEVLPRIQAALGESAEAYLVGTANYAGVLYRLGDYDTAERTLRESLAAHRNVFGNHYYGTYYTMTELGTTLVHKQQFAEAEKLLSEALAGFRDIYAHQPTHSRIRQGLDRLMRLYVAWEKPDKAAEFRALLNAATEQAARAKSGS